MKLNFFAKGNGENLAALFANTQVWPKVLTLPLLYEMSGVQQNFLKNGSSSSLKVNGSTTPVVFEYVVPSNYFFAFAQMNIILLDTGITPNKFAGQSALSNGMILQIVDENNASVMNFSPDGSLGAFKQNSDFYHIGGASIQLTNGQDMIAVNWQARLIGILGGLRPGWKIRATVRDNLSAIGSGQISVIGALLPSDVEFVY
jgi:hypothetical protein